jgi:hypothetical protein
VIYWVWRCRPTVSGSAVSTLSSMRRHENKVDETAERPDYLDEFLAQPAAVGTTPDDIDDVAKRDAEQSRRAAVAKGEGAIDLYAPRPPAMDIDY